MSILLEKAYEDVNISHNIILKELECLVDVNSPYSNFLHDLMIVSGIMVLCYSTQLKYLRIEEDGYGETEKSLLRTEMMDELIKISGMLADKEMLRRESIQHLSEIEINKLKEVNLYNYYERFNDYIESSMSLWSN